MVEYKIPKGFLHIESAPKDVPIVGYCIHEADPYYESDTRLTIYGAHCEGMTHVQDGFHVLVWGGEYTESDEYGVGFTIPDWWFRDGSEFEEAANPVAWKPIIKEDCDETFVSYCR